MFMPDKVDMRKLLDHHNSLIFPDDLVEKRMSEITINDVDALALTLLVVCEENVQVGK